MADWCFSEVVLGGFLSRRMFVTSLQNSSGMAIVPTGNHTTSHLRRYAVGMWCLRLFLFMIYRAHNRRFQLPYMISFDGRAVCQRANSAEEGRIPTQFSMFKICVRLASKGRSLLSVGIRKGNPMIRRHRCVALWVLSMHSLIFSGILCTALWFQPLWRPGWDYYKWTHASVGSHFWGGSMLGWPRQVEEPEATNFDFRNWRRNGRGIVHQVWNGSIIKQGINVRNVVRPEKRPLVPQRFMEYSQPCVQWNCVGSSLALIRIFQSGFSPSLH